VGTVSRHLDILPAEERKSRGAGECIRFKRRADRFQNAIEIVHHFIIPEPEDEISGTFEIFCAMAIGIGVVRVLAAVKLDDELCLKACEVDDVLIYRHLATEFTGT